MNISGTAPKQDFVWITIHILVRNWQHFQRAKLIFVQKSNKHSGGPQDLILSKSLIPCGRSKTSLHTQFHSLVSGFGGCSCSEEMTWLFNVGKEYICQQSLLILGGKDESSLRSCHSCSTHGYFIVHLQVFGIISRVVMVMILYSRISQIPLLLLKKQKMLSLGGKNWLDGTFSQGRNDI